MSMTLAEARSEAVAQLRKAQEIEAKYPDGPITSNEDETEVRRLLGEVDGLEAKIAALEETEQRRDRITKGLDRYLRPSERHHQPDPADDGDPDAGKSIGQLFVEHPEYLRAKQLGLLSSPNNIVHLTVPLQGAKARLVEHALYQRKALVYSGTGVGGPLIQPDRQAGVIPIELRERTLLDVMSRMDTDSDSIEYVAIKTFTNAAASVAEASVTTGTTGLKPESTLELEKRTAPIEIVAHWVPVTNKMLADAPAIRGLIDQHLLIGLELEIEDQVIDGSGNNNELKGILGTTGVQSYGAASSANVADAILHARALVRVNGKTIPNAVIMHPFDWEAVRIMRENVASATLGGYLVGPPTMAGPMTLWGMPVIEAEGMPENTALVGDFIRGATLFEREGANIRVGVINDQFVRNMQTILAEVRVGLAVWRPKAFTKVTGV